MNNANTVKLSSETLLSLHDLFLKYQERGEYFSSYDQVLALIIDEKLKELNEGVVRTKGA